MKRPSLEDLVAEYAERREAGEDLQPETFVSEHPDRADELRPLLASLSDTEGLFGGGEDLLPERLGPYRILGEISRGGMGLILEAERIDPPGPRVALKVLLGVGRLSERARERFRREVQALAALEDKAIVRVLDHGFAGGTPYLALERLDGRDLGSERPDLAYEAWARLGAELARALSLLHSKGILHRDLKPSNVVLNKDGQPVLVDFGLAGGELGATLTCSGDLLGTPAYMSPEQASGDKADVRSDIFGIGAILHECLTARAPHAGTESLQVLDRARHQAVPSLRKLDGRIPRDLDRIVSRCLAFVPQQRYASAEDVQADLLRFAEGTPVEARPLRPVERARSLWARRRGAILSASAALLLLALSLLLIFVWPFSETEALREAQDAAVLAWVDGNGATLDPQTINVLDLSKDSATRLQRAGRLLADQKAREALPLLQAVLDEEPRNALGIVMLARAARESGQLAMAERELTAAIRRLPESTALLSSLAWVQRKQRHWIEAEKSLRKALALDDARPLLWKQLAIVLFYQDRNVEALTAAERMLALRNGKASLYERNLYASLLDRNGRFAEAERVYRALLLERPEKATLLFNLAYSLDSDHRLFEAREIYRRLARNPASRARALASLAWLESGSDLQCEECKAAFADHPELRDDGKALAHCLDAVRACKARDRGTVQTAVAIAKRLGKQAELRALLQPWFDEGQRSDKELLLISRALRALK